MRLYCILKFSALYNGETRIVPEATNKYTHRVAEYKEEVMLPYIKTKRVNIVYASKQAM